MTHSIQVWIPNYYFSPIIIGLTPWDCRLILRLNYVTNTILWPVDANYGDITIALDDVNSSWRYVVRYTSSVTLYFAL